MNSLGNIRTTIIESGALLMCTSVPELTSNNYESAVISPFDRCTSHVEAGWLLLCEA